MKKIFVFILSIATLLISCNKDLEVKYVYKVDDITLNKTLLTLNIGETTQLTATISPNMANDKTVIWSSSNTNVITVNGSGLITAKAAGLGKISVITNSGNKTATCTIGVGDVGAIINGVLWATCNVDKPDTFTANPIEAGMFYQWNRKVGWSSLDPLINSNGSTTWNNSTPTGTTWEKANDPCPVGWRVPTHDEMLKRSDKEKVNTFGGTLNGVFCIVYVDITTDNFIIMPIRSGCRYYINGTLESVGLRGYYWSATGYWYYYEESLGSNLGSDWNIIHRYGLSVRCVAE